MKCIKCQVDFNKIYLIFPCKCKDAICKECMDNVLKINPNPICSKCKQYYTYLTYFEEMFILIILYCFLILFLFILLLFIYLTIKSISK